MQSMTGFGRGEHATETVQAQVEVSSVNRKQAEVSVSLPKGLAELESSLRKQALAQFSRGRLNLSLNLTSLDHSTNSLEIDEGKAIALKKAFETLAEKLGLPLALTTQDFLSMSDQILKERGFSPDEVFPAASKALEQALEQLLAMRAREGAHLRADMEKRLSLLKTSVQSIAALAPSVAPRHRELLLQRLADASLDIDPSDERVLREVALFADRCDISEELTRLDAHFGKVSELLDATKPVGRSLDFLCQELNREFNTIGSKANHSEIAHLVVEAKAELEKIREQVQNIE